MRVNAEGHGEDLLGFGDDLLHLYRHTAAVGIAQHDEHRSAFLGGFQGVEGILGVVLIAVEIVLRVVEDFPARGVQKGDGILNHAQIFVEGGPEDVGDVEVPAFSEQRDHLRLRAQKRIEDRIVFRFVPGPAGAAECGYLGFFKFQFLDPDEELQILRIGRIGPTAFNVIHAEIVQSPGDHKLVLQREGDALGLRAVSQRGIV